MKIQFTVLSPVPLVFVAEVPDDITAWRLLGVLSDGAKYPVFHEKL